MIEQAGRTRLVDLDSGQEMLIGLTAPFLNELDLDAEEAVIRWWPLGKGRHVCLDPAVRMGTPCLQPYGVPTEVVAAMAGQQDPIRVAAWFDLPTAAVEAALAWEEGTP